MMTQNLNIKVPNSPRRIKARLEHSVNPFSLSEQLIIIATGLHSHMDKKSQIEVSNSYKKAGFATLQFNFAAHGKGQNKSDGTIKDITLSSSIQDLKTIWDYSKTQLPPHIDTNHIAINANSYGALISLLALEKNIISPESMVLIAPFSMDKFKQWQLPLSLLIKLMPRKMAQILKLPVSSEMISDFLKNHIHGMNKKDLLGSTAVHFFVGTDDTVSCPKAIQRWCQQFNVHQAKNIPFVDNIQAHYKEYPGIKHFDIPDPVAKDIRDRSIFFIKQTRQLRSH